MWKINIIPLKSFSLWHIRLETLNLNSLIYKIASSLILLYLIINFIIKILIDNLIYLSTVK